MLGHQRRQLTPQGRQSPSPSTEGTPAWLLSHPSLTSLSLSRLIRPPKTRCGIQAGSPTGFRAMLEHTPLSTGAGYRGQKEGNMFSAERLTWSRRRTQNCICQQRNGKDKRGKGK